MTDDDYTQLEPSADGQPVSDVPDQRRSLYSIAISLKRIADAFENHNNGMRFICERWGSGSWGHK